MKTEEIYEQELDELIERNYYSEEWELQSAVKLYYDALPEDDRPIFDRKFIQRIDDDPSVANISISTAFNLPEVGSIIA